ncbi:MAG: hypothetical protein H0U29_03380, partial [Acidimicrobiia bacterium]|nr:hypothetical protein [Acidimicrobiia bacterium]
LGPVEAFSGDHAVEVVLGGGAARSPGWCQILADVLDRPIRTLADPGHAGARAVAAWAALAVDGRTGRSFDTGPEAPGLGSTWADRYEPDPTDRRVHDDAHAQFLAVFDALRPLRLGSRSPCPDLTGNPESET